MPRTAIQFRSFPSKTSLSVTAGKSEDEVSALKAAAVKEVIKVISVRPMSMELDPNMGEGFGSNTDNPEQPATNPPVTVDGEKGTVTENKITFKSGIGKEMVLEVEKNSDCVGGGGCVSFIVENEGNEYWVAYEWQTNDSGVVTLDMTTPDQVTLNDAAVTDTALIIKLGEQCMKMTEANLYYWWAAESWGNNYPDGTAAEHINVKSAYITYPVTDINSSETLYGDADLSGKVEIADAVKIMCYVTDKESTEIEEQGIINGDVYQTGDGLSVQDALSIQKYLAQIITELPESYAE